MNTNTIPLPLLTERVQELMEQHLLKRLRFYAEYERDYRSWYKHGDGRPVSEGGRGYSYPECIHGMSRWTSYDNICGLCEDGWGYWNGAAETEDAFHLALFAMKVYRERYAKAKPIITDRTAPDALRTALADWVSSATNI